MQNYLFLQYFEVCISSVSLDHLPLPMLQIKTLLSLCFISLNTETTGKFRSVHSWCVFWMQQKCKQLCLFAMLSNNCLRIRIKPPCWTSFMLLSINHNQHQISCRFQYVVKKGFLVTEYNHGELPRATGHEHGKRECLFGL